MYQINNKYKISRRGQRLPVNDDARTLAALPRAIPERTWMDILQKEENDLLVLDIREEILEETLKICFDRYMEKQNALFAAHCAAQAWIKLIDWNFYRHDPGEEPSAAPACFIPKRAESWQQDAMPEPSPKDSWGIHALQVHEDMDEEPERAGSHSSLEMAVVEAIPEEYWFPGRVLIPGGSSYKKIETTSTEDIISSEDYAADSELLQKVTEYSSTDLSPKESQLSALKNTTPVDGSMRGAGDSPLVRPRRLLEHKQRRSVSKQSFHRSKGVLPPLDASRSKTSMISDCRMRSLRLDTQYEISAENFDSTNREDGTNGTKKK